MMRRAGAEPNRVAGPIRVLFVANRGEIAARITRTAERLGIRAITPDDRAIDLLDTGAVVAAAVDAGADALHPGYGFLAENADFAAAVVAARLRWVGPPASAIRAVGDKAAARRCAASLRIPVIPGYDGAAQGDEAFAAAAGRIGFPLLVKPSAGGGGKGMRVVRHPADLGEALSAARREARSAFGDDRLILERCLEHPRHVEVQVLFDLHGNGVHLGDRDCSLQRRNQKVLEESPSPGLADDLRRQMYEAALRLAAEVGYTSAGTVEFLLDDRLGFFFLEMNTRLQVEHPVTEMVTGRDLVADQLRIAAGDVLGFEQDEVRFTGHAIEARLYAEDAEAGFLPATGRVEAIRWPEGPGLRVDAGIDVGDDVTGRFDPLLAKVIAHGQDRTQALDRLREALDRTLLLGPITNLRFLRWLVRQPTVLDGRARTDTLAATWPPADRPPAAALPDEAWDEAAALLLGSADPVDPIARRPTDPWAGGWRLGGSRLVRLEAEGQERAVLLAAPVDPVPDGTARPGHEAARSGSTIHLDVAGRSVSFGLAPPPDVDRAARSAEARDGAAASVVAPMPGSVLVVHRRPGDRVQAGDPIVTLEAMKMEHVVSAPIGGRLSDHLPAPSGQVLRGQLLATIEPEPSRREGGAR